MARADLSTMLGKLDEPSPTKPTPDQPSPSPEAATPPKRSPRSTDQPAPGGYRSFERKEARVRADQYADLTEEARRLNRAKPPGGERITENTLIRVAIDLLLERRDHLAGATEEELRKSVTL